MFLKKIGGTAWIVRHSMPAQIIIVLLFNNVPPRTEALYLSRSDILAAGKSFPAAVVVNFPNYQYKQNAVSIKDIDFQNLSYHLVSQSLIFSESIGLHNGSGREQRQGIHSDLSLKHVWYFDDQNGHPGYALVYLDFFSVGASSSDRGFVLLFSIKDNYPVVVQQLDFDRQAPGTAIHFDVDRRELTIKARARDGSAHCCPENLEVNEFGWQENVFKLRKRTMLKLGHQDRCCPENL